jgi:hypothetical protein
MGQGTSSDILAVFYVVLGVILALVATGFALRRKGLLRGRRAGLAFAALCVSPLVIGIVWYVWSVPT